MDRLLAQFQSRPLALKTGAIICPMKTLSSEYRLCVQLEFRNFYS